MKTYKKSLFIFRRDLRLEDNTGLLKALEESELVIPLFVFDERQIDPEKNQYFSRPAFRFMIDSLHELNDHLKNRDSKLYILRGDLIQGLDKLSSEVESEAIYVNRDYTPFSQKRDEEIENFSTKRDIDFISSSDLLLVEPEEIKTNEGKPYKVFTPFMRKARDKEIAEPRRNNYSNFFAENISVCESIDLLEELRPPRGEGIAQQGGRENALEKLRQIDKYANYKEERNYMSQEGTTRLSAHLKFGTISIREMYWTLRQEFSSGHELITELFWRDFYSHVAFNFPYVFGENFQEKYRDGIDWENDEDKFAAWQEGRTGFPIVDAAMRELNTTGWMHNRSRMIVASFLTKDLHIDWRWGEKYFAQHLVDYDPASNNGGWQWAASTGTDAQPYFRIFNPWSQQEKYDPECSYIKEYVPELSELEPDVIHKLYKTELPENIDYPEPIVDHGESREIALEMYKK